MVINHNIASLNTYNKLSANEKAASSSLQKLSSGLRINSAADDAAGLAISQKMQAQINGLDQATSNAEDGISLVQTADGALSETQSILQRMNTLAAQASNDTNTTQDRTDMQTEINQLEQEIDRIANTTQFNTKDLLNGAAGVQISQSVGANGDGSANIQVVGSSAQVAAGTTVAMNTVTTAKAASLTFTASANGEDITAGSNNSSIVLNGTTIDIAKDATGDDIASAINAQSSATGVKAVYTASDGSTTKGTLVLTSTDVGSNSEIKLSGVVETTGTALATDTFVDTAGGVLSAKDESSATVAFASTSTVNDLLGSDASIDFASGGITASYSGNVATLHGTGVEGLQLDVSGITQAANTITVDSNNGLNMQIGANQGQTMYISINDMRASALGVDNLDLTNTTDAGAAISKITDAINSVSTQRANLGAYQNRLEHTVNNLNTESQNLQSASSQITDVDMASEMTNYTKNNILIQSATAMLAQANQLPQTVLSLLK